MRRIWGERGAGDMKGRKHLRRAGIVLGFGALLCAGVMASGALGMALVDSGSTDSTSTSAPPSDPTSTDVSSSSSTTSGDTTGSTTTETTPPSTTTETTSNSTTTTSPPPSAFTPTISSDKADYNPGSTVILAS